MDIGSIKRRALFASKRLGKEQESDDFAGWVLERYVARGKKPRNFRTLFVDYLRETYGDIRKKNHAYPVYIEEMQEGFTPKELLVKPTEEVVLSVRITDAERIDRALIILADVWGLNTRELANVFGYTDSTAASKLCVAKSKLKRPL